MPVLPDSQFLHYLADLADQQTLHRFRADLEVDTKFKDGVRFDPVTEADREAEIALRAAIADRFPGHSILGEELGESGSSHIRWVLDPIDGTRPFILGIPVWATLIGLTLNGKAELGMMSQPYVGERFWADHTGSWSEKGGLKKRLSTRMDVSLHDAVLHTNSPEPLKGDIRDRFSSLQSKVKMTRYGAECYAFAMLAAGRIDISFEPSLQPYDIVALIPIIEQAGGIVTSLDGNRPEAGGAVLASASTQLHEEVLSILAQQ